LRKKESRNIPGRKSCVAMAGSASSPPKPRKILFVCLGNICRSPTAEAVFRAAVEKRGLGDEFEIDSAGTIDYHQGDPADRRMTQHAVKRGVKLTSISRPVVRSDFETFDLILAMDESNQRDLHNAFDKWSSQKPLPEGARSKVKLMCEYCRKFDDREVPDPYYGGSEGFEKVLDLLDDACEGLLDTLVA
jgi:protein-tyrosine phosphatase